MYIHTMQYYVVKLGKVKLQFPLFQLKISTKNILSLGYIFFLYFLWLVPTFYWFYITKVNQIRIKLNNMIENLVGNMIRMYIHVCISFFNVLFGSCKYIHLW